MMEGTKSLFDLSDDENDFDTGITTNYVESEQINKEENNGNKVKATSDNIQHYKRNKCRAVLEIESLRNGTNSDNNKISNDGLSKDIDDVKDNQEDDFNFSDDDDFAIAIEESSNETGEKRVLSQSEKDRAERNRLKALTLKKSRVLSHPYLKNKESNVNTHKAPKQVDTGGGFFIEEDQENEQAPPKYIEGPAPFLPHERPECLECEKKFDDSYLYSKFDHCVCDNCREMGKDGEHELITKTEAKSTFLLKDLDLEKCEHGDALRFITRKNPHKRGGEMKLFLRLQVEKRAEDIWGSQEALEAELEAREEKKIELKSRKYNRQMKALRMAARSSLYKKDISTHVHQYQDEIYHPDKDEYSQTCATCGHINVYEKM